MEGGQPLPTVSFARRGACFLFTPGSSIVDFFISPASHFDLIDKIVVFFRAPDEVTMPCHESLCKIYVKNQE